MQARDGGNNDNYESKGENTSLLITKFIIRNNCFRKTLAQNLFMQGSILSLHFPYLLSDTVLQFPALDVFCAYYIYDNGFDYIKSSSQIVCQIFHLRNERNLRR